MFCYIYRSNKKENCYLYTDKKDDFNKVPEKVLAIFGKPIFVMEISLDGNRRFNVGSADEIKAKIEKDGFFLQLLNDNDFKQ